MKPTTTTTTTTQNNYGLIVGAKAYKSQLSFHILLEQNELFFSSVTEPLTAIAATKDGSLLFGGSSKGHIYVWETATGELLTMLRYHYRELCTLTVSPLDAFLVSSSKDGLLSCWNISQIVDRTAAYRVNTKLVSRNRTAARGAASMKGSNAYTGGAVIEPWCVFKGHTLPITSAFIHPESTLNCRLYTTCLDKALRIFHLPSRQQLYTITFPSELYVCCTTSVEDLLICAGHESTTNEHVIYLKLLLAEHELFSLKQNTLSAEEGCKLGGHKAKISSLLLTRDDQLLVSGSVDGEIILWNISSRQSLKTIKLAGRIEQFIPVSIPTVQVKGAQKQSFLDFISPLKHLGKVVADRDRSAQQQCFDRLQLVSTKFDEPAAPNTLLRPSSAQGYVRADGSSAEHAVTQEVDDEKSEKWAGVASELYNRLVDRM